MKPRSKRPLLLRFHPRLAFDPGMDLAGVARNLRLAGLTAALAKHQVRASRRLLHAIALETILSLEARAEPTRAAARRSLASYWVLDPGDNADPSGGLLEDLRALPEVDTVYPARNVGLPTARAESTLKIQDHQHYLGSKSDGGLDARWAWSKSYGRGAGAGLVLCDIGWNPRHHDLRDKGPFPLYYGVNRRELPGLTEASRLGMDHGTAALGVTIARGDRHGLRGIAYESRSVAITSHYDGEACLQLVPALVAAMVEMRPGDILLLEAQQAAPGWGAPIRLVPGGEPAESLLPVETDDAVFDAIRLATALGFIVIEPAANGSANLGRLVVESGTASRRLDGSNPDHDSGAILVAASAGPRNGAPHPRSNYGRRIDCHAWGSDVLTAGYGGFPDGGALDENRAYSSHAFSSTSAASALVAGVAMVVQGAHQATQGRPLDAPQMRSLLGDRAYGIASSDSKPIGVMPNLKDLLSRQLRGPSA